MSDLKRGTLVEQDWHPRAIFRFSEESYFLFEQFWGRAARASWVRKNPDARLVLRSGLVSECELSDAVVSLVLRDWRLLSRPSPKRRGATKLDSLRSLCSHDSSQGRRKDKD